MTRRRWCTLVVLVTLAGAAGAACQLKRPDTIPARMIEPRLVEPSRPEPIAPDAIPIRLLDAQARSHIGRRLLHQEPGGELVEDPAWRWSSAPTRYLDSALRLAVGSRPDVRLVDAGTAPEMLVTLIEWHLEAASSGRLAGALELEVTRTDRTVRTHVIRASEPVSTDLPGNLASASGRLLNTLASESVTWATQAVR